MPWRRGVDVIEIPLPVGLADQILDTADVDRCGARERGFDGPGRRLDAGHLHSRRRRDRTG
jgi:hypothetical protein